MLELLRKYRTPLLAAMLVLASLLLYSHNLQGRARTSLFERVVLQMTAPFHSGIEAVCDTLGGGGPAMSGWWIPKWRTTGFNLRTGACAQN